MASIEFAARAKNKIKEAKCSEMLSSISWYDSTESNFHFDQKKIIPKRVSNFNHSLALHALSYFVSVYVWTFSLSLSLCQLSVYFLCFCLFSLKHGHCLIYFNYISLIPSYSLIRLCLPCSLSFFLSVCLPACLLASLNCQSAFLSASLSNYLSFAHSLTFSFSYFW
jgi:hypothetical protein